MANTLNRLFPIMALIYPLFFVLLFYISSLRGEMVALSLDAFTQPYVGESALVSIVLSGAAIAEIFVYYFAFYQKYLGNPNAHLILLVMPEMFAVIGFVIGFLNWNPWASLPYILLGFAIYLNAYLQISRQ